MHNNTQLQEKQHFLLAELRTLARVIIAYSGGVDSAFLLRASLDAVGRENVLAVIGVSPSYRMGSFNERLSPDDRSVCHT